MTLALSAFKAAVLGSAVALAVTSGVGASVGSEPRTPTLAVDSYAHVVQAAMTEHDCSTDGFAPGVQPRSALVRMPRGELLIVSFDRGWEVFTGERNGLLVAVCLGERPRRPVVAS